MNRLPRSRSVGSVGSLDGFNESLKYSKLHKKHGARPLPSYALPLGVALLIATAFFVAQVSVVCAYMVRSAEIPRGGWTHWWLPLPMRRSH